MRNPLYARSRRERLSQQQTANLDFDLRIVFGGRRNQCTQLGLDLCRVLFRNNPPIDAKGHLIRNHIGVDAAFDQPDVQRRRHDAIRARAYARERGAMRIQG